MMLLIFSINMHELFFSKIKKETTIKASQKNLGKSNRKANKIGEDKGSTFYNRSMKLWLEKMT